MLQTGSPGVDYVFEMYAEGIATISALSSSISLPR